MAIHFVVHDVDDSVGVATTDLEAAATVHGRFQRSDQSLDISLVDAVPLGHKIALRAIPAGERVLKYGEVIGRATTDIREGAHVHTHNLKGERWA